MTNLDLVTVICIERNSEQLRRVESIERSLHSKRGVSNHVPAKRPTGVINQVQPFVDDPVVLDVSVFPLTLLIMDVPGFAGITGKQRIPMRYSITADPGEQATIPWTLFVEVSLINTGATCFMAGFFAGSFGNEYFPVQKSECLTGQMACCVIPKFDGAACGLIKNGWCEEKREHRA